MEEWGKARRCQPVSKVTIKPKLSEELVNGPDTEAWSKLWAPSFTESAGRKNSNLGVADVVLWYQDVMGYEKNPAYHGAIVRRVTGSISNAKFTIPIESAKKPAKEALPSWRHAS